MALSTDYRNVDGQESLQPRDQEPPNYMENNQG